MNALQLTKTNQDRVMWLAVGLAVLAALAYGLMAAGLLGVGDVQLAEEGGAIVYAAAGCYLVGGLLILPRRRWLWIAGAVINALVMLFFFNLYRARPAVIFSPGGLASKSAQLLLEAALIYLIVAGWLGARRSQEAARDDHNHG
jgi:hypothetical protein